MELYRPPKKILDRMTLEELRTKNATRKLGWDRKGYGKEIKVRENDSGVNGQLSANTALYDLWTKQ
jgi:hypothetical protein